MVETKTTTLPPTTTHGLAATIQSSTESETFDLGGLGADTIQTVMRDAFGHAFDVQEMIRLTFIVGAGKQGRQKYDAGALKVVTSTLASLNFTEERGASCVNECAGMYKFQHDTGKNLKTVVVFPKLSLSALANNNDDGNDTSAASSPSIFPTNSMEYKIAVSSMAVFKNMVQVKCPTWSQKKALLSLMDSDIIAQVTECDDLMMRGQPLSDVQQSFYDACSELSDKRSLVQQELHAHIDRGDLTELELDLLQSQVKEKINDLKSQNKTKSYISAHEKAVERQKTLQSITPHHAPSKLRHHAALGKAWKQLQAVQHLDEHSGKLLSLQDTQLLGQKMDILEQIGELESSSRGWLEEDDVFQARLHACRKEFQTKFGIGKGGGSAWGKKNKALGTKSSGPSAISSNTKVRVPITKWVTPQETKSKASAKKKARMTKGDVFGAMMAAESDDSEDDDDDDVPVETQDRTAEVKAPVSKPQSQEAAKTKNTTTVSSSKKNKKKNKKNSKAKAEEGAIVGEETNNKEEVEVVEATALTTAVSLVQTLVVAILGWFIALLFGKPKKKKKA
jgi:hypothetical protein